MTRFEAAALLNACLERVTEQTDELQRLINEFQSELTVLRGRVDGLEKKVGKLEAQQFSTTTKLKGEINMVMGGVAYTGNSFNNNNYVNINGTSTPARNGVSFNYDYRLNLNTSFTGKDLLFSRLRGGNWTGSAFSGTPVGMAALDKATSYINNTVNIDRLYYQFPIGKEFTGIIGPRLRNTEMVAFRPQAYNPEILDFFTLAGAPGAYNKATGGGFGLTWKQSVKKGNPYMTASVNFVSEASENGNPGAQPSNLTTSQAANPAASGGMFSSYGRNNLSIQVGGRGKNWGVAAMYRYGTCGTDFRRGTPMASADVLCNGNYTISSSSGSPSGAYAGNNASTNSLGLGAYWQPEQTGWIPSISIGWGYSSLSQNGTISTNNTINNVSAAQSWSAMFQWDDAFAKGNSAGFAMGQGVMTTATRSGVTPNDSNFAFEWFYRFRVSDNISITPAIFYLSNPNGQQNPGSSNNTLNNTGILVNTRFTF